MGNTRRYIRVGALLVAICAALWAVPAVLDSLENARMPGRAGPVTGEIVVGAEGGTAAEVLLHSMRQANGGQPSETPEEGLVLLGAEGLTDEERAALLAEARANSPLTRHAEDDEPSP